MARTTKREPAAGGLFQRITGNTLFVAVVAAVIGAVAGNLFKGSDERRIGPARESATQVRYFEPWDPALGPARISHDDEPRVANLCMESVFSRRTDVARCFTHERPNDFLHDPCFLSPVLAPPGQPWELLCPKSPWSKTAAFLSVTDFTLADIASDQAIPAPDGSSPNVAEVGGPDAAWALELANGRRCVHSRGGTATYRGGLLNAFNCDNGGFIVGHIETEGHQWYATYFGPKATRNTKVFVEIAWY